MEGRRIRDSRGIQEERRKQRPGAESGEKPKMGGRMSIVTARSL